MCIRKAKLQCTIKKISPEAITLNGQLFRNIFHMFQAYKDAVVYVRRLNEREKPPDDDPDFDELIAEDSSSASKRIKLGNGKSIPASTSSGSAQSSDFVRRSNRSKRVRGAKEFHVSSDMLLRDLKVKVSFKTNTRGSWYR